MVDKNIFLVGAMGAGKSTVGRKLSDLLGMQFFDSDQLLENIFTKCGEAYFRHQEQILICDLAQYKNIVIATGGGCILHKNTRDSLLRGGVVCYLRVSPQQQLHRDLNSLHRPKLPPHKSERLKFFQQMQLQRSDFYESIAHLSVDTDDIDADTVAKRLLSSIQGYNESH